MEAPLDAGLEAAVPAVGVVLGVALEAAAPGAAALAGLPIIGPLFDTRRLPGVGVALLGLGPAVRAAGCMALTALSVAGSAFAAGLAAGAEGRTRRLSAAGLAPVTELLLDCGFEVAAGAAFEPAFVLGLGTGLAVRLAPGFALDLGLDFAPAPDAGRFTRKFAFSTFCTP